MISAFIKTCDEKIGGKDKIWNQPTDVGPGRSNFKMSPEIGFSDNG